MLIVNTYRMSIKSVSILYISRMVQNYKKSENTCSIILRGNSFKEVDRIVKETLKKPNSKVSNKILK